MNKQKRIISLDVIRAYAVLGIFIVHLSQYYGFDNIHNYIDRSGLYAIFKKVVTFLLDSKMRNLLSMLFGVTFYFLMSKPDYGVVRFCRRCAVLMMFGLINMLFYTTDILMWFGLNGFLICILRIWKLNAKLMLLLGLVLVLFGPDTNTFLRSVVFMNIDVSERYLSGQSIVDIVSYPYLDVVKGSIHAFIGTSTLGYIIIGYGLAKMGVAHNIDNIVNRKVLLIFIVTFVFSYMCYSTTGVMALRALWNLSGVCLYATIIVLLYNKFTALSKMMGKYGKMTLTHYSCQEIVLPCVFAAIIIPYSISFGWIVLFGLVFYCLQVVFSYYWLKRHQYGPLEYLWRKCS